MVKRKKNKDNSSLLLNLKRTWKYVKQSNYKLIIFVISCFTNTTKHDIVFADTQSNIDKLNSMSIDEIASQYRLLLKENTETLAIIDHQLACVAFSHTLYI